MPRERVFDFRSDIDDVAVALGLFADSVGVDLHQRIAATLYVALTISLTLSRAWSTFDGSLPPAWAKSGRPPPPPPTIGATCLMILPAWKREVRSLVTEATIETFVSPA